MKLVVKVWLVLLAALVLVVVVLLLVMVVWLLVARGELNIRGEGGTNCLLGDERGEKLIMELFSGVSDKSFIRSLITSGLEEAIDNCEPTHFSWILGVDSDSIRQQDELELRENGDVLKSLLKKSLSISRSMFLMGVKSGILAVD